MMRYFKLNSMKFYYILLLLSTSIFAQTINQLDSDGKKDGPWKGNYSESKRPRYQGVFNHGKEQGLFQFFDDTSAGTVIATRSFDDNDGSCFTVFYNQRGNKVSEGKVVDKVFEGPWKYYHEDSQQIMTAEFYVSGKLEGVKKVFYPSGKLAQETVYKNGLKEGLDKRYSENGTIIEESNYKNNEFDGLAIFRSPSNVVVAKGLFVKGKKSGIWEFNTNGKISKENYSYQSKRKFAKKKAIKKEQ